MSKTPKRKATPARRVTPSEQSRIDARNALNRAVRREREIQALTKRLARMSARATGELESFVRGYAAAMGFDLVAVEEKRAVNG